MWTIRMWSLQFSSRMSTTCYSVSNHLPPRTKRHHPSSIEIFVVIIATSSLIVICADAVGGDLVRSNVLSMPTRLNFC